MGRRVYIFDTTLRDGEQSPGVNLMPEEKVEIARQLSRLGVDVIEAGFPITSQGDFEAVQAIARTVKGPTICALARIVKGDIDRAAEALAPAERRRIHVFTSGSDIHIKHILRKTREEVIEQSVEAVKYAKTLAEEVEFSPQDCTRSDPEFLYQLFGAAIAAGADVINVPDTVGYTTPEEFAALIRSIRENTPGADRVIISVHCHNDLGLAVANSLAALRAGASQVECAVNGIGERAGNCSLEEVVMALRTRRDFYDLETGVDTRQIYRTSRLVSQLTGMPIQPNKAIVGANAFAHESGIHQDGVLKERTTYEIMRAEDIGLASNAIILGKHSGRHAFADKLKEMGYDLTREEIDTLFNRFKELTDRKKDITERDVQALVEEEMFAAADYYKLEYFHVTTGNSTFPTATVSVSCGGTTVQEAACGDGPVDALCRAIDRATGENCRLVDFSVKSVTEGKEALGEVIMKVEAIPAETAGVIPPGKAQEPNKAGETHGGRAVIGRGVSTDILEATARAYINALNKLRAGSTQQEGAVETA